ncbi:MAG TPA: hypothetical protein VKU01_00980 [Bryobacteraceae bacterium]|nr:hypothetical protein [Bryobacteraceae bacterium]
MSGNSGVQIVGPEFTGPATGLSQNSKLGSIGLLLVYPGEGAPQVQTLVPALKILKNYFSAQGSVVLYLSNSLVPASLLSQLQSAGGVPVNFASESSANTVATKIQADAQKQQMQRWKILQDIQTRIFQIQQDVTTNKAKAQDKAYKKLDGYIRG